MAFSDDASESDTHESTDGGSPPSQTHKWRDGRDVETKQEEDVPTFATYNPNRAKNRTVADIQEECQHHQPDVSSSIGIASAGTGVRNVKEEKPSSAHAIDIWMGPVATACVLAEEKFT